MAITTTIGAIISQGDGSLGLDEGSMGWGMACFMGHILISKTITRKTHTTTISE